MGEISKMLLRRFIISKRSIRYGEEISKMNESPINSNTRNPFLSGFVPRHSFESTLITAILPLVADIYCARTLSQVMSAIIQGVVVFVISLFSFLKPKDSCVHSQRVSMSVSSSIKTARIIRPQCVPIPLRQPMEVLDVNDSVLSLRKRDKAVGWVERLSDFVSANTTFGHILPPRRVCFSRYLITAVSVLFLTLLIPSAISANQRMYGFCAQNATVTVSGISGIPAALGDYPRCTVTIYVAGTTTLATLYSDNLGTPLSNPFTAGANGYWFAYAANGRYDAQLSGAGMPTSITYGDILLNDAGNGGIVFGVFSSVPFSATPIFNAAIASVFSITLTGNVTSSTVNAPVQNGQVIEIYVCQDATGGRSWTWPANFTNVASSTPIATGGNACTPNAWWYSGAAWQPFSGGGSGATGIIQPSLGGTGTGTPTAHGVAVGEGGSTPFTFVTPSNNGQCLMSAPSSFATTDPSFQSCPTGTGGTSAGPQGTIQAAGSGAGSFQTSNLVESGGVLTVNETESHRGPNPAVDVTAFNARAVNPNSIPATTGTITGGTSSLSVTSATGWQKNDGIAVVGAGATNCTTAPAAPIVTPSLAASGTGTGYSVAGAAGSTEMNYVVVAISQGGCYTAASPLGTTTTANATLGLTTLPITSSSNSAGTVTVTVGSTASLANGTWFAISGTTDDQEFGFRGNGMTIVDATHFTYQSPISSIYGMTNTSATGGTLTFFVENSIQLPTLPSGTNMYKEALYECTGSHLTTCALPSGAANYSLIYISYPLNLGYTSATYGLFDDYGSTMTPTLSSGSSAPWFLPSTPPSGNSNDMLVTTITNISGTTFTLAVNATNSVTAPVRFDDAPAIVACQNAAVSFSTGGGGTCHVPPSIENSVTGNYCYVTSSYFVIGNIDFGSPLCLGDTASVSANPSILHGTKEDTIRLLQPQFAPQPEMPIYCLGANPCLLRNNGVFRDFALSIGASAIGVFDTSSNPTVTDNLVLSGAAVDATGIPYYFWNDIPGTGLFGGHFTNFSLLAGSNGGGTSSDTPAFLSKNGQQWVFDYVTCAKRGFYFEANAANTATTFNVSMKMGEECQGPISPIVMFNNANGGNRNGYLYFEHILNDSGGSPVFVNASIAGTMGAPMVINGTNGTGSGMPIISGKPFSAGVWIVGGFPLSNNQLGMNHDIIACPQANIGAGQNYSGCKLPALSISAASYSANHTLTGSEGAVVGTATLTFTIDSTLNGQEWDVFSQSGTTTLSINSGTLFGNGSTGSFVIPNNQGVRVFVRSGNAYAVGLAKPYAGTGAGIVTGPTSSTNNDLVSYTGITGQIADSGIAQSNVALRNASNTFTTGVQDLSAVTEFRPKSGLTTAIPATCTGPTPMDVYIATDAQPGRNWYFCTATNVWTQQVNTGDLGLNTYAASHTMLATESWANFSATATATIPHLLTLNKWVIYNTSASGTVTLAPDSGNITLNGATAATATIAAGLGVEVSCDGTNCFAWGLGGGSGSGTVSSGTINGPAYYTAATTVGSATPPTSPNGVPSTLTSTPSGGVSQPPALSLPGIVGRAVSGIAATDTILSTDCNPNRVEYVGSVAVAVTLPTAVTLGVPKCVFKMVNATVPAQTVTITPTTWTINGSATLALNFGQQLWVYVDPNSTTNWVADQTDLFGNVSGAAVPASAKLIGTNSSSQLIAAALSNTHMYVGNASNLPVDVAVSGDMTIANTGVVTVSAANGGAFPTSANVLSTNASKQPVTATAHNIVLPWECADTSGSGIAQVCNTSPTFTPVSGDTIIYTTTTANTGTALTINVNSLGAKSVAKWQTSTILAANDIRANTEVLLTYDGTNWELTTIGNAPAGGSAVPCTTTANSAQYNNAGAFGCMAEFTYASSTLTLSTTGKLDLSSASVTAGFKLPSAAAAAPTATGICSYDTTNNKLVCGNGTNTSTPTWTTSAPINNVPPVFSGTQGLLTNGYTFTAGTVTSGHLACYTSSGTVGNCTGLAGVLGVFNSTTTFISSGETSIALDATVNVTFGDNLCASSTSFGTAHDNGTNACTTGLGIGTVKTTASSVSSATAFVALR